MDRFVSADTIWVLIGAFLVFSMQPGFAMVETGFTRAKNAANIVMKNVMDMSLGSIVFWILGLSFLQLLYFPNHVLCYRSYHRIRCYG